MSVKFALLPSADVFVAVGKGIGALSVLFATLPSTDEFGAFEQVSFLIVETSKATVPSTSLLVCLSNSVGTRRQTSALCWGQQQDGKSKQNGRSKFSHRKILAEIRGDLKSVFSSGLGDQVTNIGADVR